MRRGTNVSECVDITNITLSTNPSANLNSPFSCTPDGNTRCNYKTKTGEVVFSLTCECALAQKSDIDLGYCPLPTQKITREYIEKIKKVRYQDNCHTYDRESLNAQIDCGCGDYDSTLEDAVEARFKLYYYPYIHDTKVAECISNVVPDSKRNVFV